MIKSNERERGTGKHENIMFLDFHVSSNNDMNNVNTITPTLTLPVPLVYSSV